MAEFFPRIEALGGDTSTVHGCGCFGCVFPSKSDDRWVYKLTGDKREGPMWEWIHKNQKQGVAGMDAFVFVSHVESVDDVKFRKTLVKREEVDLSQRPSLTLDKYFSELQSYGRNYLHRHRSHTELAKEDAEEYEKNARIMAKFPGFDVLSRGLVKVAEKGIYLGDLHAHNVGRSIVDWGKDIRPPGTWVVFDPGMTSVDGPCPVHGPRDKALSRVSKKARQARPRSPKRTRHGWGV